MIRRVAVLGLALAGGVFAQRLTFEVASVKANTSDGPMDVVPRRSGDLVMMHNTQPFSVIFYAYRLRGNYQIVGYVRLPDGANWFDIDARAGRDATDDQVREMFQSLLEDRFKLEVHRENRDIPAYELTIGKGKSKLAPAREGPLTLIIEERNYTQPTGKCSTTSWRQGAHLVCHSASMESIVDALGGVLKAPVV